MAENKTTNIAGTIYEGKLDISYDCPVSGRCKLGRFEVEPPPDDSECTYREY